MPSVNVQSGSPPASINLGDGGGTVVNDGPSTVYYNDELPVTTGSTSLTSGSSAALTGVQFFTADTRASIHFTASAAAAVTSSSTAPVSGRLYKAAMPFDPIFLTSNAGSLGNFICGCRVAIPVTGTLHDLTVLMITASGNLRVGVYDTGDASAGNRSLLYGSGSVAAVGVAALQTVADPNIAVTAGQHLDFVVLPDNNTMVLGKGPTQAAPTVNTMPASFLPVSGGASPKLNWTFGFTYAALPATISEANCAASSAAIWIGGRIA
jgi:hypothetical protein